MNSWWPPVLFTLAMWAGVPFMRPLTTLLRERGFLRPFIGVLIAGALGALFAIWHARTPRSYRRLAGLSLILALEGWFILRVVRIPEERIHFLQIGLLSFLLARSLSASALDERWAPWLAGLLAGLAGGIEEAIQIFVPARYFDWRDVGFNAVAALLSACLLRMLQPAGRRTAPLAAYPGSF